MPRASKPPCMRLGPSRPGAVLFLTTGPGFSKGTQVPTFPTAGQCLANATTSHSAASFSGSSCPVGII